jgi:hypothetical protein
MLLRNLPDSAGDAPAARQRPLRSLHERIEQAMATM